MMQAGYHSIQDKADNSARKAPQDKKLPLVIFSRQQVDDPSAMETQTEVTLKHIVELNSNERNSQHPIAPAINQIPGTRFLFNSKC